MEQQQSGPSDEKKARSFVKTFLLRMGIVAFVFGGLVSGVFTLSYLNGSMINAPRLFTFALPLTNADAGAPDWSNKERVNILFLGVDRRPNDYANEPTRTDTMMLVTLDPYTKTASMVGIPRDLWVPIPYQSNKVLYDRINTPNVYGDLYDYPGGGPALTKDTVQYNLGVRVHYYVMIDFDGFRKLIDSVGGLDIDVPTALDDWEYPTDDYKTMRVHIPVGLQHLDGERTLQYARSRHIDSDFGRMKRQQLVLMALRNRMLQLDMVTKIGAVWNDFNSAVQTDLSLSDILNLGAAAREISTADIQGHELDLNYVTAMTTEDGASILLPRRSQIGELVAQVFFDPRKEQEAAHIEVLNSTTTTGLATRTAQQLQKAGFLNVTIGDAAANSSKKTEILNLTGKSYTTNLLASYLKLPKDRVQQGSKPDGDVTDIRIILGDDAPQILPQLQ